MKQLSPLTGLRGIAAYSVLVAHGISSSFGYGGVNLMQPFASRLAYFGMSLFFVLSGFVIHYNYASFIKSEGYLFGTYEFLVARFARLYPLYIFVFICSLDGIPSGYFHNQHHAEYSYLTMTQSWFNLQDLMFKPAWSISTEWFFYFSFVLLLPFFSKIKKPVLFLSFYLILAFLFMPKLISWAVDELKNTNGWVTYFSPYTRIFDFIAGVLASIVYFSYEGIDLKSKTLEFVGLFVSILWVFLVIFFDVFASTRFSILSSNFIYTPPLALAIILVCRGKILDNVLCNRGILFMGEISYSVYLLGFMVMTALGGSYISREASLMAYINSIIKIGAIISLTTLFAYGAYKLVEMPSRTFLRKNLSLKSRRQLTAADLVVESRQV